MTEPDETTPPGRAPEPPAQPERKKVKCDTCGAFVDVEEITTARGKFYCPDCLSGTVAIESLLPFRERFDFRAIKWTVLGCGVALIVVVFVSIFMLIYTYMRLDKQLECRDLKLRPLYQVMAAYAREYNAYPPDDNDLRPLYGRHTTNLHFFVCPGTTNTVTGVEHLKDDSASPDGEGMSYFYRGGYRFIRDKEDEPQPLVWDQSPANHKGRGVNVVFNDGHHEYWTDRVPELGTGSAPH
jgi:prepilin-type processing-associated H-X9-DG protein